MVVDSKCASANSEHQYSRTLWGSLGIRWRLAVGTFIVFIYLFSRTLLASDGLVNAWLPRQFLADGIYLCACNTPIMSRQLTYFGTELAYSLTSAFVDFFFLVGTTKFRRTSPETWCVTMCIVQLYSTSSSREQNRSRWCIVLRCSRFHVLSIFSRNVDQVLRIWGHFTLDQLFHSTGTLEFFTKSHQI